MEAQAQNTEAKSLIVLFPQAAQGNTYLQKIRTMLQGEASVELVDGNSSKEIADLVQKRGCGLVIFSIRQKEDLTIMLNALGEWNPYIKGKFLRVIGVCQIAHQQIPPMLMKRGCADLFSPTLNDKALRHKINQSLKILDTYHAQNGGARPPALGAVEAQAKAPAGDAAEKNASAVKKIEALKLASDVWLVRKERDLRQVQGRWIVDMIGPGPSAGIWDDAPKEPGVWEWKPKATPESKDFITDEGAWFYKGRKPEFVWDIGRWRFLGDAPELFFRKEAQVLATRFRVVKEGMEVTDNSPQAQAKLPMIIKSIENEVHFKNEQKAAKAPEKEVERRESRSGRRSRTPRSRIALRISLRKF